MGRPGQDLVHRAGDHDGPVGFEAVEPRLCDGGSVHPRERRQRARVDAAPIVELGAGEARAEGRDMDAALQNFLMERLGERGDVSLCRTVDSLVRRRRKTGRRRDIQQPALASRHHAGEGGMRQNRQRLHVEADLSHLDLELAFDEEAGRSVPGIVHDDVDDLTVPQPRRHVGQLTIVYQVSGEHVTGDGVNAAELVGHLLEAGAVTGDHDKIVAATGEKFGKCLPDPGGGAGDEGGGAA